MRGGTLAALVAAALGGCAYQVEPIATPVNNVVTSYSNRIPGKWLLYVEAERLNMIAHASGLQCAAHNYPVNFQASFPASVRSTLPNVFGSIETADEQLAGDRARAVGASGVINVRGESISARFNVIPGFWSARIGADVEMSASVIVDGPSGRLFGKTVDGRGHAETDAGFACSGAAEAIAQAAQDAQKDALRRLAEEIGNSERLRAASAVARR